MFENYLFLSLKDISSLQKFDSLNYSQVLHGSFLNRLQYSPCDIDGKKAWKVERLAP